LPIFATLCSNDYFKIENYPRLKLLFKNYNKKSRRRNTKSINSYLYKNIINFILDMKDKINSTQEPLNFNEYNYLTSFQKLIFEKIFKFKPNESSQEIEEELKNNLIDSVQQYQMFSSDPNRIYEGNYDESLKSKILSLNKDILESYYLGNFNSQLMNGNYY